jgi:hypothetical protein
MGYHVVQSVENQQTFRGRRISQAGNQHEAGIKQMEATCSSKTSIEFKRNTRHYIPEDRTLAKLGPQYSYFLFLLHQASGPKACCCSSSVASLQLMSSKTSTWGGYQLTAPPPTWRTSNYSLSDPYPLILPAWVVLPGAYAPASIALRVTGEGLYLSSQTFISRTLS